MQEHPSHSIAQNRKTVHIMTRLAIAYKAYKKLKEIEVES